MNKNKHEKTYDPDMERATYNKADVIRLSGIKYPSEETLKKHLDQIIDFLSSERTKKFIRIKGGESLNREINPGAIRSSTGKREYRFNEITALILAALLRTFDEDFMIAMIGNKTTTEDEADIWLEKVEEEFKKVFKVEISKYKAPNPKSINVRFMHFRGISSEIFAAISLMSLEQEAMIEAYNEIEGLIKDMSAMGFCSRYDLYSKNKKRFEYMKKLVASTIDNMDHGDRLEYDTNREMESGKINIGSIKS